jgi:hypothetical protein
MPRELYELYAKLLYETNQINGLDENEKMLNCFTKDCPAKWIVWREAGFKIL